MTSQDTPATPPLPPTTPAPPVAPAPETPLSPVRTPRLGVKALIIEDGHVLMNHLELPERYTPPGGGQEHGEDQVSALIRECHEEIGARVEVHQVACVFEVLTDRSFRDGTPAPLFHQVNVAYWCGLAEGQQPSIGSDPDSGQVGTAWLPLDRLADYDVRPAELARWLLADPSDRPVALGAAGP